MMRLDYNPFYPGILRSENFVDIRGGRGTIGATMIISEIKFGGRFATIDIEELGETITLKRSSAELYGLHDGDLVFIETFKPNTLFARLSDRLVSIEKAKFDNRN